MGSEMCIRDRKERLKKLAEATSVNLTRDDVYNLIEASDGVPLP